MNFNYIKPNDNCQNDQESEFDYNKNNNSILQNKNYFKIIQNELSSLKNKEDNIKSLSELSKELYFTSIPVIMIITAFIELLNAGSFNLSEYLILNSIMTPASVLLNSFICGTSHSRKKKLANIDAQIKSKEEEFRLLCHKINGNKNNIQFKNITYKVKPIDHTYENIGIKPLTKTLSKDINN